MVLLSGSAAVAQQRTISARAGSLNYQRGVIFLDGERLRPVFRPPHPVQMQNGQVLRVENGRVELVLGMGVYLRMLGPGSLRMQENHLDDARVAIEQGSALIEVAGMMKGAQLRILCGDAITELRRDGSYRFDAPAQTAPARLRVFSGEATVQRNGITAKAKSGTAMDFESGLVSKIEGNDNDALQTWAAQRSQRRIESERRRIEALEMRAARRRAAAESDQ